MFAVAELAKSAITFYDEEIGYWTYLRIYCLLCYSITFVIVSLCLFFCSGSDSARIRGSGQTSSPRCLQSGCATFAGIRRRRRHITRRIYSERKSPWLSFPILFALTTRVFMFPLAMLRRIQSPAKSARDDVKGGSSPWNMYVIVYVPYRSSWVNENQPSNVQSRARERIFPQVIDVHCVLLQSRIDRRIKEHIIFAYLWSIQKLGAMIPQLLIKVGWAKSAFEYS